MKSLFVNAYYKDNQYYVDIKTLIVIYIFKLSETSELKLRINLTNTKPDYPPINIILTNLEHVILNELPDLPKICTWPVILLEGHIISGLCSVSRQICKLSNKLDIQNLLGFREACLVSCAESSVWTKFCEIDVIKAMTEVLSNNCLLNNTFTIPIDMAKYENHLSKPVRIHNIYKIAREKGGDQSLTSSTPRNQLQVFHDFAEGPNITLADVILYPCFQILFDYCSINLLETHLPLTIKWFKRLDSLQLPKINFKISNVKIGNIEKIIINEVDDISLYKAESTRMISVKHTKQHRLDSAFNFVKGILPQIINETTPFGFNEKFSWEEIPLEANPQGGALPKKRAARKCEQLENLAKAVLKIAKSRSIRIVDFCSGSGHLGILLATLLPNCQVILVENKETSLARAKETILKLKLNNLIIVQSNLDYFVGSFDLGVALHACGVATDLVIQMCIKKKSSFICCPCCYGGIKNSHEVTYPRSKLFKDIFSGSVDNYFNIAHAADQTHDDLNAKTKQGYFCMDIIDTDRKFYAESCGYEVHLGKLQPITCTNKNNLLVGIFK